MPRLLGSLLIAALLIPTAAAQTTGVPFINDYTINGCLSGSTSCTTCALVCPAAITFAVSCAPLTYVEIYYNVCPCFPDFIPLPASGCAIPFTAAFGASNQSVDLNLACGLTLLFAGVSDLLGNMSISVALPPGLCGAGVTINLATQAVIYDPVCTIPFPIPLLLSQAYDLSITF